MRTTLILSGATLLVGVICFGADDEKVVPKRAEKVSAQPAAKSGTNATESPAAKLTEKAGAKTSTARPKRHPPVSRSLKSDRPMKRPSVRRTIRS